MGRPGATARGARLPALIVLLGAVVVLPDAPGGRGAHDGFSLHADVAVPPHRRDQLDLIGDVSFRVAMDVYARAAIRAHD